MRTILRMLAAFAVVTFGNAWAEPVYFLVAELPGQQIHHDSYVLPLTDAAHIEHARALVERGPVVGQTIAVARIAAGSDGINRNYALPGAPAWSWHVTDFIGFADVTAEILDGWPTLVESDVAGWIENTGGLIGFWSYTAVAEVAIPEPSSGLLVAIAAAVLIGHRRWHRVCELGRARSP